MITLKKITMILTEIGRFEAYYAVRTQSEANDAERALGLTFRLDF